MPIYEVATSPPEGLTSRGAIFPVQISLPKVLMDHLTNQELPIPSPVSGTALIDTGSSVSVVDLSVLSSLQINPISIVTVLTPAGPTRRNLFPARFIFPGLGIDLSAVIGFDLRPHQIIALIGRDILSKFLMIYHGNAGRVTLTY